MRNNPSTVASFVARSLALAVTEGALARSDFETIEELIWSAARVLETKPDAIANGRKDRASVALVDFANEMEHRLTLADMEDELK